MKLYDLYFTLTYRLSESDKKAAILGGCSPQGNLPAKAQVSFYLHDVIGHIRDVTSRDVFVKDYSNKYNTYCASNNNGNNKVGIFLLTMRYEYANLYHTSTDWFNVFQMIRTLGLERNDFELIFLDGHSQGSLDKAWNIAYSNYNFVKQLNDKNNNEPLCLERAVFAPVGYMGGVALNSMHGGECKKENKYVTEFAQWFVTNFGFEFNKTQRDKKIVKISIICRKDYMAHPRNAAKFSVVLFLLLFCFVVFVYPCANVTNSHLMCFVTGEYHENLAMITKLLS